MTTGPIGPFIHSGQAGRRDRFIDDYAPASPYSIWLLRSGTIECRIGTQRQRLQAPVAILQFPPTPVHVTIPAGADWLRLLFDVMHRPLRRLQRGRARMPLHLDSGQPPPEEIWGVSLPWRIPPPLFESCYHMLSDCLAWWWRSDLGWLRANHRLGTWLTDLVADVQGGHPLLPPPATSQGWLPEIIASIQQRLEQQLDIGQLAALAGMSATTFRRRFQAATGLSPRTFLAHERMRRACHLLAETDRGHREVARLCGFTSSSTFSRRFKEWTGASPTTWRRHQHAASRGRGRVPYRPDPDGQNAFPWS